MTRRIHTGCEALNEILGGGYETDAITTIYGPAGAGKTNLALLAAVETAKTGKKVIFIDTEGGFSVERLQQVCEDSKKILERIFFFKPMNFEEQKEAIAKTKEMADSKVGLIIVDTIGMLFRLERKFGEDDSVRELGLQIVSLTEITRKKEIPVIMTNQVYSTLDNGGKIQMVGGDLLRYGSKCLLEIQPLHANKRRIVLRKHRSVSCEKELIIEINNTGISAVQ